MRWRCTWDTFDKCNVCIVCLSVRHFVCSCIGSSKVIRRGETLVARRAMRNTITVSVATCIHVLEWMDAHEDSLPFQFKKCPTVAQRAEYLLRNKFMYLISKTYHPPEVRALLDQISQQRTRSATRPATRKPLSSSTTNCQKVLEWMDAHEGNLPVLIRTPTTDAQRAELVLRRQFN